MSPEPSNHVIPVPEHQPVLDAHGRAALTASSNPGILVVHDIGHAIEGIYGNPTGLA